MQNVPLRLKLSWTRRLAVEFPWEGRLLALMASQASIQDLLHVEGAQLHRVSTKPNEIAKKLHDHANKERVRATLNNILAGQPSDWWFEDHLPRRAAEELRRAWARRYPFRSLQNTVATSASPGAFVLAVFLEAYLSDLSKGSRIPSHSPRRHLRIALDAHTKHPRSDLLLNLGQAAHRLEMDRTAWYLLLKSARSLPAVGSKELLKYRYVPWLLSALADLARKAGANRLAQRYETWFEERVLAAGLVPPDISVLMAMAIAPE